jgi:hypothetical protein
LFTQEVGRVDTQDKCDTNRVKGRDLVPVENLTIRFISLIHGCLCANLERKSLKLTDDSVSSWYNIWVSTAKLYSTNFLSIYMLFALSVWVSKQSWSVLHSQQRSYGAFTCLSFGKIKDVSGYLEPTRFFIVKISHRLIMQVMMLIF